MVFCTHCGVALGDDSQFCGKCGHARTVTTTGVSSGVSAAAVAPAREVVRPEKRHSGIWLLIPVLMLVIGWAIYNSSNRTRPVTAFEHQPGAQPQPHADLLANTALTVNAGGYAYYKFAVPSGASNARLEGRFVATGGSGNDLQVYILTEDGFVNWKNGHPANTYYNSGRVTQDSFNASLPSDPATYYLVFDNRFSLMTPKAAQVRVVLHYVR